MPILTAQTSVDGFYRLAGMPDGSYLAAVVLPPDFTAISPATVAVNVGDGGAATAHFAIRPDVPNQRPVIDAISNQEFKVNDAVAIQVHATDADDVVLTYAATGLPADLVIDPATGLIHGLLTDASAGFHQVKVTVSDPWGASSEVSFTLTVVKPTALEPGEEPTLTPQIYLPVVTRE